jgi:uncharacterized membrane protein YhaH (DUF805 family)
MRDGSVLPCRGSGDFLMAERVLDVVIAVLVICIFVAAGIVAASSGMGQAIFTVFLAIYATAIVMHVRRWHMI